jgi:hypothetical protein
MTGNEPTSLDAACGSKLHPPGCLRRVFPPACCERIAALAAIEDPERVRREKNWRTVELLRRS